MKKSVWIFLFAVLLPSVVLGWLALRSAEEQQIVFERRTAELYQKETEALAVTVRDTVEAERRVFGETVRRLLAKGDADALARDFTDMLADAWPVKAVGFAINKDGKLVSPSVAMASKQPELQRFLMGNSSFLTSMEPAIVYNWGGDNSVRGKLGYSQMKQAANAVVNNSSFLSASRTTLKDGGESIKSTPVAAPNPVPIPSNQQGAGGRIALGATLQEDVLVQEFRTGVGGVAFGGTSGNAQTAATPAPRPEMPERESKNLRKEPEQPAPTLAPANAPVATSSPMPGLASTTAKQKDYATDQDRGHAMRAAAKPARADDTTLAPDSPNAPASRVRAMEFAKATTKLGVDEAPAAKKQAMDKLPRIVPKLPFSDANSDLPTKKSEGAKAGKMQQARRVMNEEKPAPDPMLETSGTAERSAAPAAPSSVPPAATVKAVTAISSLTAAPAPVSQMIAMPQEQGAKLRGSDAFQANAAGGAAATDQADIPVNVGNSGTLTKAGNGTLILNSGNVQNRLVEPQQLIGQQSAALSAVVPETAEFRSLTDGSDDGMVARFVQDKLNLIFWLRPPEAPEMVFGCLVEADHFSEVWKDVLERHRSSPRGSASALESQPEFALALLDDRGKPVATRPDSAAARDWKHPFVASEIGEVLPHWEAALYLASPTALAESARGLWRTLAFTIAGSVALIAFGGWLVVADARRQLALAQQKTDFVSNVSHELKTPLTSIRMFAELMHDRPQPAEKQSQYLRIITVEAERLTRLINNVLDFAKIGRKQKRMEMKPLDMHPLVARVWESQELHLREAGFTARWEAAPGPYPVLGDDDALAQVLVNLLSNAEKYSTGRKDVELHTWLDDCLVNIAVMDRGMGVPNGDDRKIFEAFYRAHDSLNSGIQGSGLGLTLAQRIAHEHGGEIRFERREGGGCRFTLRLPLAEKSGITRNEKIF